MRNPELRREGKRPIRLVCFTTVVEHEEFYKNLLRISKLMIAHQVSGHVADKDLRAHAHGHMPLIRRQPDLELFSFADKDAGLAQKRLDPKAIEFARRHFDF